MTTITQDDKLETKIRSHFARIDMPLAERKFNHDGYCANSQYGFTLKAGFPTAFDAAQYSIEYYKIRMHLIDAFENKIIY